MDVRELAWAGGLFDGEGCISQHRNRGTEMLYIQLDLGMTDEDVVLRFQQAVGGLGKVTVRPPGPLANLPLFHWRANSFEVAQAVIALLWYGLSPRRRSRAREVLVAISDSQQYRRNARRGEACSECDRAVWARGFCNKHYAASRYANSKDGLNARRRQKHAERVA